MHWLDTAKISGVATALAFTTIAAWAENPIQIEMADDSMFQTLAAGTDKPSTGGNGMHFAQLPAGLSIPVRLVTNIDNAMLQPGSHIEGVTATNVRLPGDDILAFGTRLAGTVKTIKSDAGAPPILQIAFDTMILSNGVSFPIAARVPPFSAQDARDAKALQVRLTNKAQLAVTGSVF